MQVCKKKKSFPFHSQQDCEMGEVFQWHNPYRKRLKFIEDQQAVQSS